MKISIYDGADQIEEIELPGDIENYDIIIRSESETSFPKRKQRNEPPEVPGIDVQEIETENRSRIYKTMRNKPKSQPAEVRRAIYQREFLLREHLEEWAREQGYAPRSGNVQGTLVVLDEVTNEIERVGEGDERRIIWNGEFPD